MASRKNHIVKAEEKGPSSSQILQWFFLRKDNRQKIRHWALLLLVTFLSMGSLSCQDRKGDNDEEGGREQGAGLSGPFESFGGPIKIPATRLQDALSSVQTSTMTPQVLWALSHCQCADEVRGSYFQRLLTGRGALPQVLLPAVRTEIRKDPKLKVLASLGGLGNILAGIFASDDKIAKQISENFSAKLKAYLPGGSDIGTRVTFRLDGFYAGLQPASTAPLRSFSVLESSLKWLAVLSDDTLWEGKPAGDAKDYGRQMIVTLQSLAELSYSMGLDPSDAGIPYGGLTFDPTDPNLKLGAYDPRKKKDPAQILSGRYDISFDDAKAVDLAINAQEKWSHKGNDISLREQAQVWIAGAMIFKRLRPENRSHTATVFGSPGQALLPNDAHKLGLTVLPGLRLLTKVGFVDKDNRKIFNSLTLPTLAKSPIYADLGSINAMARALYMWMRELTDVGGAQIEPNIASELSTAPAEFKAGLQLASLSILDGYVSIQPKTEQSVAQIRLGTVGQEPTLVDCAETIATLAMLEKQALSSEFLRERVIGLFHWYVGKRLVPALLSNDASLTAEAVLWTSLLLKEMALYPASQVNAAWLPQLNIVFNDAVKKWSQSFAMSGVTTP